MGKVHFIQKKRWLDRLLVCLFVRQTLWEGRWGRQAEVSKAEKWVDAAARRYARLTLQRLWWGPAPLQARCVRTSQGWGLKREGNWRWWNQAWLLGISRKEPWCFKLMTPGSQESRFQTLQLILWPYSQQAKCISSAASLYSCQNFHWIKERALVVGSRRGLRPSVCLAAGKYAV